MSDPASIPTGRSHRQAGRRARPGPARRSAWAWIVPVLIVLMMVNWFWAGEEAKRLGGVALGGYVADGHYFLNDHNRFNEVSRATWEWSLAHWIVTLASWPALFSLTALLSWRRIPWLWIGSRRGLSLAGRRMAAVEASGRTYLVATPGIEIAGSPLPVGTELEFHPDGLVVRVGPANEVALARSDVSQIEDRRREAAPRIVVHHAAPGLGSPIEIAATPDSDLWDAVLRSIDAVRT